jgi:5-methylcytosine-specific restriction endonuclease McrA
MRICSGAGCLRAVLDSIRLCDECKPTAAPVADSIKNHTSGYDAELDRLRKSPRWQRLTHSVLRQQPMCARCQRDVSALTDHIVPAREAIAQARVSGRYPTDRFAGYFLRTNLQGLCRACHWVETNEDKIHRGLARCGGSRDGRT